MGRPKATYLGAYTIVLEADVSTDNVPGPGGTSITRQRDSVIVKVENGSIYPITNGIKFSTRRQMFCWNLASIQRILDKEGEVIWPKQATTGR